MGEVSNPQKMDATWTKPRRLSAIEAYRVGREIGVFGPTDIRRRENETPIPGGDVYHQPANWSPLDDAAEAAQ